MKLSFFQAILLGVFAIAAVVGIFVFATYTGSNSGSQGVGKVTIWGVVPKAAVDAALAAGTQSGADLKGVTYVEKDPAAFDAELTSAIATGAGPDLVLISQEDLLALGKLIQPIPSSTLSASTFNTAFAQIGGLFYAGNGSGAYGIPFLIDPLILFDNRTILSSAGIAEPPATWEAVTGLASSVVAKSPTGTLSRALIALGTYANVHDARAILSALFLQAGAPLSEASANGYLAANLGGSASQGTPPGQAVLRFYTQFADPEKVSYTWNAALPDSQSTFLAGDLALYLGFASEARYLAQANPNLNFEPAPFPQPQTAPAKATYGLVYAFAIPRGSVNSAGAYQAAAALTGIAEDSAASAASGMAPADRALLAHPPSDPAGAVAYASALYARGWLSPAPANTDTVFSAMITNVISGRQTIETALATAESSLSALLQQ